MTATSPSQEIITLNIPDLSPRQTSGLRMQLHNNGDQMISARLRKDKIWEQYETLLTLKHLHAGDVYVDVGANIGYYTLLAAQRVGEKGKVIAYEPDPDNFTLLNTNVSLNSLSQVHIFPYALYDKNGEGQLFLSDDNFGDHRVYGSADERHCRAITLVNGSDHLSQYARRIDFLKIDTQGAEFFVVNGLKDVIMENRGHLRMILEFCPYGIRNSGANGHDLLQLLDATGMQYHIIDHQQECLIPAQSHHLADWITQMANEPLNEGFVNLLVTPSSYVVD